MNTHACLKCKASYTDDDVDAYYCATCLEEKKRVAAEIDARIAARPHKETRSALQEYDASPKGPGGFVIAKL